MGESVYRQELRRAMQLLAQDKRTIFIGQTVGYPGSRYTYETLSTVPLEKRIELPIAENMQMGISAGLALGGYIPVSIYPRCDFTLLAADQMINHLDKIEEMSEGQFKPKVIIRAVVGGVNPIDPGPQHRQDYTEAYRKILTNIDFIRLERAQDIVPSYKASLDSHRSSFLLELGDLHFI